MKYPVFREKTPTQRTKLLADNKFCFSRLNGQHSFRRGTKLHKFSKQGFSSTQNTLLQGSETIFPQKFREKTDGTKETTASNVTVIRNKNEESESPGLGSATNVHGLSQGNWGQFAITPETEKVLVPCDRAFSHSRISQKLARKLNVQGILFKLTINGIQSHETIDKQIAELKLTPFHSGGSWLVFVVKLYVMNDLNDGTEVFDVESLQVCIHTGSRFL